MYFFTARWPKNWWSRFHSQIQYGNTYVICWREEAFLLILVRIMKRWTAENDGKWNRSRVLYFNIYLRTLLQIRLALQSLDPPLFPGSVHVQARVEAVDDVRPDGGAAPGVDSGQRAGGSQISKHRLEVCFGILYLGRKLFIGIFLVGTRPSRWWRSPLPTRWSLSRQWWISPRGNQGNA